MRRSPAVQRRVKSSFLAFCSQFFSVLIKRLQTYFHALFMLEQTIVWRGKVWRKRKMYVFVAAAKRTAAEKHAFGGSMFTPRPATMNISNGVTALCHINNPPSFSASFFYLSVSSQITLYFNFCLVILSISCQHLAGQSVFYSAFRLFFQVRLFPPHSLWTLIFFPTIAHSLLISLDRSDQRRRPSIV